VGGDRPGNGTPDQLLKLDPKSGQTEATVSYPFSATRSGLPVNPV